MIVDVGHVDDHRCAVFVHLLLNGKRAEVLCLVVGYLLSVHGEALREIAEAIQETYGTHIDVGVGSLFYVVAGQHAETAAIDFQGRMDAVLHAEVGYGGTFLVWLHVHVVAELRVNVVNALHQFLVLDNLGLAAEAQTFQQHDGIVLCIVIEFRVEVTEEVAYFVVPHPPHIVGELVELTEFGGNVSFDNHWIPVGLVSVACFNFHNIFLYNYRYYRNYRHYSLVGFIFFLGLCAGRSRRLRSSSG